MNEIGVFPINTEKENDWVMGPGCMTEYGWYDAEIENGIKDIMIRSGMNRTDAIIHFFNNI